MKLPTLCNTFVVSFDHHIQLLVKSKQRMVLLNKYDLTVSQFDIFRYIRDILIYTLQQG